MNKKLKNFHELVDQIEIAMMTTRRPDGHLVSRPMDTQDRADGADLWFVTSSETEKLDELESDPHVNLAYFNPKSREWISVSGTARISRDRETIEKLHDRSWDVYFPKKGGKKDGSPSDPRIILIGVDIHSVFYLEVDKPKPVVLFEIAKGFLTGQTPNLGKMVRVTPSQVHPSRKRAAKAAKKTTATAARKRPVKKGTVRTAR